MSARIGELPAVREPPPGTVVWPVMLATIDVPFAPDAVDFAVESAVETGARLLVVDAIPIPLASPGRSLHRTLGDPEVRADQERVTARAREAGADVQQLMFSHPRPLHALIVLTHEQHLGLLVLGADRARYGRWRFRRAARRLRSHAACLVWPYD